MNSDFIRLKNLEGELKLTQMNSSLGCSVTTKELVFFKPHITFHLFLHDIVHMVPITVDAKNIVIRNQSEYIRSDFGTDYYRILAKWVRIVKRSGIIEREDVDFIVPLSAHMLKYISQYSGLTSIP